MKNSVKKICLIIAAALMAFTAVACESNDGKGVTNKDFSCVSVYYGTYAQDVVTDEAVIALLKKKEILSPDQGGFKDGRVTIGSTVYERAEAKPYREGATFSDGKTEIKKGDIYYFTVQPIEWYVLKSEGGSSVVLSKNILDVASFNTNSEVDPEGRYANNWAVCSLRTWLNDSFAKKAFDSFDLAAINNTKVVSRHPQSYYKGHASAIADTYDQVYCLSYAESVSGKFTEEATNYDCLRMAKPTDYARAVGAYFYVATAKEGSVNYEREMILNGNGEYWLRTVGQDITDAATVRYNGIVGKYYRYVNTEDIGVRPVVSLGIDL